MMSTSSLFAPAMAVLLLLPTSAWAAPPAKETQPEAGPPAVYGKLPLFFVKNEGQFDPKALYYAKGPSATLWFTREGIVFDLVRREKGDGGGPEAPPGDGPEPAKVERFVFSLGFLGRAESVAIEASDPQEGRVNYFIGKDPSKWKSAIPTFGSLAYKGVWPGIDLVLRDEGGKLKYEFRLAPRADPGAIRLAYEGIESLRLTEGGDLAVRTPAGEARDEKPRAHQEVEGRKADVGCAYRILEGKGFGFEVAPYDKALPLVIDPCLSW